MQEEHSRDGILGMSPEHDWFIWLDANGTESLVWERKSRPAKEFEDQNEVVCRLTGADGCSSAHGRSLWHANSCPGLTELFGFHSGRPGQSR